MQVAVRERPVNVRRVGTTINLARLSYQPGSRGLEPRPTEVTPDGDPLYPFRRGPAPGRPWHRPTNYIVAIAWAAPPAVVGRWLAR